MTTQLDLFALPASGRVLGLREITEHEIMHRWYILTGNYQHSSIRPTPEEYAKARAVQERELAKWYAIGRDESLERFAAHDDDQVILNYWHFARQCDRPHTAYEQGTRDAFALIAERRGLVIPDLAERTPSQRCICLHCRKADEKEQSA